MGAFSDLTSLQEARAEYFEANGLGEDGGYARRWAKVRLGPVPIWIRNTAGRRAALLPHDLHHVATGYDTTLIGEAEIGAWELASGCGHYYAAWLLNIAAVLIGLPIAPARVWRAFLRGRHSENLYRLGVLPGWPDDTVGGLRQRLGLHR